MALDETAAASDQFSVYFLREILCLSVVKISEALTTEVTEFH